MIFKDIENWLLYNMQMVWKRNVLSFKYLPTDFEINKDKYNVFLIDERCWSFENINKKDFAFNTINAYFEDLGKNSLLEKYLMRPYFISFKISIDKDKNFKLIILIWNKNYEEEEEIDE